MVDIIKHASTLPNTFYTKINVDTYVHINIHTYIHTYIHTCINTCRVRSDDRQREVRPPALWAAGTQRAVCPHPVCLGRALVDDSTGARPSIGPLALLEAALGDAAWRPLGAPAVMNEAIVHIISKTIIRIAGVVKHVF